MANREDNLKPAWGKGESGNPNGRPKGSKNRATIDIGSKLSKRRKIQFRGMRNR